ncbi:MAG: NEAT domain-containing protein, partial [Eubacterium sp.]|nr:NEAT domain-containing protein [Eubacterium sp.]
LVTDIINGTSKEPLYIYGFNGYYEGNDTSKSLKEAAVEMNDIQYSDDVFGEDEKVVTKVSFPLEGDFAAIYNTNADIYVPAMKNLNGLVSGIDFKQGRFSADCFVKVYWDSLTKTSSDNNKSDDTTKETTFGSAKTTLTAGTYSIPASLKNAGNVSQDSMAAGCIKSAQMTVAADGTAAVTVDLQSVSFAGLTAYASNWKIYQGTSADGKTVDAQYTTDEEGRVTQITFTLPDNSYDGVYVNMFVDAMNYSPDAYLALDYANAVKTAEPDPAPTPDPSDNKIADGNYYVPIALWNAVSDKASMGNAAFEKNSSALITVKDGKVVKVQIAMNPVTVTSIYSAVTAFEVEGVTVTIDKTEKITTSAGNEVDAIRLVTFELPEGAQPSVADITYADVSFKVPDTPMGDTMMSARLRFDWSALTATSDTSLVPAEDQTEEKSPAVDVTDEKTGIHVSAAEGVLPEGSELKVTKVSAGTEYTKAANALADVGSSFELYEVHFEKDGQEVEPEGSVVVKYLIPAGMNADNVVLYRINDDGSKTLIKGSVENGYYVVTTKGFSYYALVEKAST